MKNLWKTARSLCMMAATLLYVSCGLIDMELGEGTQYAYDMTLEYDSIYVRIGDSVLIKPVFVPDSVSNSEVLYLSEDENVATIVNDTVVAMASGEVLVTAMSVLGGIADTCKVYVMEPWVLNPMDFANDMVVYATATVDGKPFDPETMDIAAFAGPEFRGMGELKEINGIRFLQFRIYGELDLETMGPNPFELIHFACYDKANYTLRNMDQYLYFDGETHGSLSNLYQLTLSPAE